MLGKKYRFHSRGGVRYAYQYGKTLRTSKMSLIFVENVRKYTRFAVVVSKKVDKSAVIRNTIRRKVYEVLRKNMQYIPKNTDYVFVVYSRDILAMPVKDLENMVGELVEQSKVCYNKKR